MRISFLNMNPNILKRNKSIPLKHPSAQNPINFTAQCSEKDFKLKDIPNLHCPVCGLVMLNPTQRKTFVDDVAPKTGEALIEALNKYEDETALVGSDDPLNEHKTIYRPLKAKILEVIKRTAKQNPNLNLLQIVKQKRTEFLAPLIKQQLSITSELEEYLETVEISEDERKTIKGIIEEFKSQILGESEVEFKRKNYIHALSNVVEDPEIQEKITGIIECLPQSKNDVNSFFVKYSKEAKSSRTIASKFVDQSIPTAEHLKPRSKGGKNNTDNYICDCADCNSARCNTDFDEWLREKPELAGNLQKYIEDIQKIIDEGNFPVAYDSYVDEVVKTIAKLSYGKLKLKVPKSKSQRINDTVTQKRQAELDEIKKTMADLYRRKELLKEKIEVLEEDSRFSDIVQLELVRKQIEKFKAKLLTISENLSSYQKDKKEVLDVLDRITFLQIRLVQGDGSTREEIAKLNEQQNKSRLAELEAKINVAQKTIDTLTNKLNRLEKREKTLSESVVSTDEVEKQIKEISRILTNYNSNNYRINALKDEIFDEKMISERLKDLRAEILKLKSENISLKSNNNDVSKDRSQYEAYLNKVKMFEAGDEILSLYQEGSKLPKQTPNLIEIAQESIRNDIAELMKVDSVQYFVNIDRINALREEQEILKERLAEISSIKEQLSQLELKALEALEGNDYEELNKRLDKLTRTKNTVSEIKHISELKAELEIIEDTISHNENILYQLRNFKNMSSEQFQEYISMIFY